MKQEEMDERCRQEAGDQEEKRKMHEKETVSSVVVQKRSARENVSLPSCSFFSQFCDKPFLSAARNPHSIQFPLSLPPSFKLKITVTISSS